MIQIKTSRIESIDILRGVVMIIMALDHVRDYFHYDSFFGDPSNIETTTPILFFTRFITHYCAPVFIFLAGTSAFLYGSKKTKPDLFKFLLTRGVWLIFLEIVVNNFIWTFDFSYSAQIFQVIWAIGFSMICLSFLIYLPKKILLVLGVILVVGHNALDNIIMKGENFQDIVWYLIHQQKFLVINPDHVIVLQYPVIPWIGLIILGYLLGTFYQKGFDAVIRRKWLLRLGVSTVILFFSIRGLNIYGDLTPWTAQDTIEKTIFSFFSLSKYPPSFLFFCITIGPALLFLYLFDSTKNKITDFFLVFGRVPLFYYFLHVLLIHLLAIGGILIFGGDWKNMILSADVFMEAKLINYGYSLPIVYLIWISVILLLYPLSKKYMTYKANNKNKWWLSYL